VASGLLTFFLVFYSQQCYQRFYMFYDLCIVLSGSLMEWVSLVRTHFEGDAASEWNATRYMLVALCVHTMQRSQEMGGIAA